MSKRAASRVQERLQRIRRPVQVLAGLFPFVVAALVNLDFRAIIGSYYALSFGPLRIVDPLMAFQSLLLSRSFGASLAMGVLIPIGIALLLGRVFCSWICPYNSLMELWGSIERRFWPVRSRKARRRASKSGNPRTWAFWGCFALLLLLVPITGLPLLSYLSPPGLLSSQITQGLLGMGLGLELALVGMLLLIEIALGRRWWCRQLCPVGAGLGLFHNPLSLRVTHDPELCQCHALREPCHLACPIDLVPKRDSLYPSCLNCGLCLRACERTGYGALQFRLRWSGRR